MATTTQHQQAHVRTGGAEGSRVASEPDGQPIAARLTTEQVWHQVAKGSFAVLSHVTPAGEPRSSGVLYKTIGRRLYIVTAPDSWKARHVAASGRLAVTVPVRRGGLLSLVTPIPPATISFHASATVHPANSPEAPVLPERLAALLPAERRTASHIIEIVPEGQFVTYGVGVPLRQLANPALARARVPVA